MPGERASNPSGALTVTGKEAPGAITESGVWCLEDQACEIGCLFERSRSGGSRRCGELAYLVTRTIPRAPLLPWMAVA